MKAVDPTIKVGAVLTMPGNWPDGIVGARRQRRPGTRTVLTRRRPAHRLRRRALVPGRRHRRRGAGQDRAPRGRRLPAAAADQPRTRARTPSRIGISLTEINVGVGQNTQPGALFLADAYSGLLEQRRVHRAVVERPQRHRHRVARSPGRPTTATSAALQRQLHRRQLGLRAADEHAVRAVPRADADGVLRPTRATSWSAPAPDNPLVSAHAARRPNGDLAVLLVNKDPDNAHDGRPSSYQGCTPSAAAPTVATSPTAPTAITSAHGGHGDEPDAAGVLADAAHPAARPARGRRAAGAGRDRSPSAVTDRTATISWPAAPAGQHRSPSTRCTGRTAAISEQLGETTGTSFTVRNLEPGTPLHGQRGGPGHRRRPVSWSSPPLTFTTGSPGDERPARCSFADTNDWGNGYVGSVDITNNAAGPGQRLDAGLHLAHRVAEREQRLERHLDADRHRRSG